MKTKSRWDLSRTLVWSFWLITCLASWTSISVYFELLLPTITTGASYITIVFLFYLLLTQIIEPQVPREIVDRVALPIFLGSMILPAVLYLSILKLLFN